MERPRLLASFFSSETGSFSQVLVSSTVETSVRALCRRGVDESCLSPELAREARSIVCNDEEVEENGENRTNNVERSKKDGEVRPGLRATCAARYFDGGGNPILFDGSNKADALRDASIAAHRLSH